MGDSVKPAGMVTIDLKLIALIATLVGVPTVGTHLVSTQDLDKVTAQLEDVKTEQVDQKAAQTAMANKVEVIAKDVHAIKAKWDDEDVKRLSELLEENLKKGRRR